MVIEALLTLAALLIYVALRGIFSEAKKPADNHEHVPGDFV
jgi:hypothetical protein